MFFRALISLVFLCTYGAVHAQNIGGDGSGQVSVSAIKALAILQTLNANLLASKSATSTLEAWCEDHQMAPTPKIIAVRDVRIFKEASKEVRALLKVSDADSILYRRVQLACGEHILSQADNWYVPSRLTENMNFLLMQTDTPFGIVVRPLNFHRQTLRSTLLWNPLPKYWEKAKPNLNKSFVDLDIPESILQHQAILLTEKNIPFSVVIETYTKEVFAFPMAEQ